MRMYELYNHKSSQHFRKKETHALWTSEIYFSNKLQEVSHTLAQTVDAFFDASSCFIPIPLEDSPRSSATEQLPVESRNRMASPKKLEEMMVLVGAS